MVNVGFSIGQFLSGLVKSSRLPELDDLPAAAPAWHSLDGNVAHLHPERGWYRFSRDSVRAREVYLGHLLLGEYRLPKLSRSAAVLARHAVQAGRSLKPSLHGSDTTTFPSIPTWKRPPPESPQIVWFGMVSSMVSPSEFRKASSALIGGGSDPVPMNTTR